jgi:hypothetical protein
MRARRPVLKRIALWTAAVVLLLAGYVAGAPFANYFDRGNPIARPVLRVLYVPLVYVAANPDAPGHDLLTSYLGWSDQLLRDFFE